MTIDSDEIPELLNWYEGMLLMPWHFQQSARRQEALSSWLVQAAAPNGWGVRILKSHLHNGIFQVDELEAMMPDRLVVRYRDSEGEGLRIDLKGKLTAETPRICVQLAVFRWHSEALGKGAQARYLPAASERARGPYADMVPDADDQGGETPWLRPVLQLQVTASPLDKLASRFVGLPLACFVQHAEDDRLPDYSDYQPPSLTLGTSLVREGEPRALTPLLEHAAAVRTALLAKAAFLNSRLAATPAPTATPPAVVAPPVVPPPPVAPVAAATGEAAPVTAAAVQPAATPAPIPDPKKESEPLIEAKKVCDDRKLTVDHALALNQAYRDLNAVTRTLPRLNALVSDTTTHPQTAFLALCDVLGDLSVLGGGYRLSDTLPTYNHLDSLKSFEDALHQITTILEKLNQKYRAIRFERTTTGSTTRFVLKERPPSTDGSFTICAFPGPGRDIAAITRWMEKVVIATEGKATELVERRVKGAHRRAIERDTLLDVTTSSERQLYAVENTTGDIVKDDTTLIVDGIGNDAPTQLFLYVAGDAKDRAGA